MRHRSRNASAELELSPCCASDMSLKPYWLCPDFIYLVRQMKETCPATSRLSKQVSLSSRPMELCTRYSFSVSIVTRGSSLKIRHEESALKCSGSPPSLLVQLLCRTGLTDWRRSAQTMCIASVRTCRQTKSTQFVICWMGRALKKEAARRHAGFTLTATEVVKAAALL